jgi:hypothetical protein
MPLLPDEPARWPIRVYQGASYALAVAVTSDGDPADLTGMVAKAEIRNRPGGKLIASFETAVVGSTVEVLLTPEEAVKVRQDAHWDLRLSRPGFARVLLAGPVTATERVTE